MRVIVHYTVKPTHAVDNARLIKSMCRGFNEQQSDGLRYASFQGSDGVTFYHLAFILGDDNPLPRSDGFNAFKKEIAARCHDLAVPTLVSEVGSYGFCMGKTKTSDVGQ